jgi:transposase-like protein
MPKRRYSDDDRANAIAALAANGGFVKTTARQLGIPAKTLENWSKGTRHPEAANMGDIKKKHLADALGRLTLSVKGLES